MAVPLACAPTLGLTTRVQSLAQTHTKKNAFKRKGPFENLAKFGDIVSMIEVARYTNKTEVVVDK